MPVDDTADDPGDNDPGVVTTAQPRPETPADLRRRLGQLLEADNDNDDDDPAPAPSAPANPFGVTTGTARPGMITPVPAPRPAQGRQPPDSATQP